MPHDPRARRFHPPERPTFETDRHAERAGEMMLERRLVLRAHVLPLIGLTVRKDQLDLVSSNAKTLAEAAYETGSYVWGLWDSATLVGLMAMINPREHPFGDYPFTDPRDGTLAAYLWRLMVGADFQGNGYGGAALAMAFDQARAWNYTRLMAHVSDAPHSNLPFYQRYGFETTGLVEEDELVIAASV